MNQLHEFKRYLQSNSLAANTIESYVWTVEHFLDKHNEVSENTLLEYKGYLMEKFSPKTVNLRIQGINKYLAFSGKQALQLKAVKIQQKNFLENVISNEDYQFLKKKLKADGNESWYFVVWYLAATGARVSELIQIKVEHVNSGYFDLYSKGGETTAVIHPKKASERNPGMVE